MAEILRAVREQIELMDWFPNWHELNQPQKNGSIKDFSRVNLAQVDNADIQHCIDSSLVIEHNVVKTKAEIVKEYGAVPQITCSPSQINQVI